MSVMAAPADTVDPFASPDYWEKRAAETRATAESLDDAAAGQVLRQIVRQYERLARRAARLRAVT